MHCWQTLLVLTVGLAVRAGFWVWRAWCVRPASAAPTAGRGGGGGRASDDVVRPRESDDDDDDDDGGAGADLDGIISSLQGLIGEATALEDNMRREMAAVGKDYDAWAAAQHLVPAQESAASKQLASLLALQRAGPQPAAAPSGASSTRIPAQTPHPPPSFLPAGTAAAEAAAAAAAFSSSAYTLRWRQFRQRGE